MMLIPCHKRKLIPSIPHITHQPAATIRLRPRRPDRLPSRVPVFVLLVGHEPASLGIISLLHIDAAIDITLAPMNSDNILVTNRDMTDILNNVALVHVGDR